MSDSPSHGAPASSGALTPPGNGPASREGLAALLEASRSLVASLDLQTVLQAAVDGVERLAGLGTSAVYLLEGDGMLRLWATTPPLPPGFPEELRMAPLADHPHLARALEARLPVLVPDMPLAELSPAEADVARQRRLRTVLYLPLVSGAQPVGALIVGSVTAPRPVTGADVDLCRTLANLAAVAVENARLFRSVQQQAEQLRTTLEERERSEEARERLQAQLLQAQKMESIGRLAGGVAHDFNNMLQVILSYTELSADQVDAGNPLAHNLREIRHAARRSADLTQQLLAFARRQAVEPKVLELNETVGSMVAMLRRLIGENIELDWRPGRPVGAVRMDPVQVEQVLANLCVNARDAIGDTGRITVETSAVAFDPAFCAENAGFLPGEFVMLSVSDDGSGMDGETLAHVFEPFFTTKAVGQGTGLGLATVYGIVSQNGGFITVQSEPGRGSTFRVHLPRHRARAGCPEGKVSAPEPGEGAGTILLVEDEPAILRLVTTMLRRQGYVVLAADAPQDALRLAGEHEGHIDLLLTDVVMPAMNGRDLADRILELRPGLRCLFMSGYTADAIARHGVHDQELAFIAKPFTLLELTSRVRELLRAAD